jgi:hypothetical protein
MGDMTKLRRLNGVMAGRVEVAIIFKEMLGVEDAAVYLAANGVPGRVAERVLAEITSRRISDDAVVGHCKSDSDIARPNAPGKQAAPNPQEPAVALQSKTSATSNTISARPVARHAMEPVAGARAAAQ